MTWLYCNLSADPPLKKIQAETAKLECDNETAKFTDHQQVNIELCDGELTEKKQKNR